MSGKSFDARQIFALQFGREMRQHADFARITLVADADAVAVAVNQLDRSVRQHDAVAVIHVAHDVIVFVQTVKSARDIRRRMDEKLPRRFWENERGGFSANISS